ncbi:DUF669 domain-containing protein [Jeotgalibaca porci]|uniref:DUF669 domain-containing protein n=2 Tax=Jeotgalibaca porci TaxID=1868793 RepID=UPI0035A1B9C9
MSFLTTNYSGLERNTGFEALPKGNYEVIITKPTIKSSKAGREYINMQLVVRNDLDKVTNLENTNAKYHNRVVFASIFTDKETNQYNTEDLLYYLDAVQVPEGTEIKDMQHYLDLIADKPVRVYVTQSENEYQGEKQIQNNVWANSVEKSQFPQVNHVFKDKTITDPFSNNQQPIDESEISKNLPF